MSSTWGGARPGSGRPRKWKSDAERKAAYKERRAANPDKYAAYVRVPFDQIAYARKADGDRTCGRCDAPTVWGYCLICTPSMVFMPFQWEVVYAD